jgi:hypothetical protein
MKIPICSGASGTLDRLPTVVLPLPHTVTCSIPNPATPFVLFNLGPTMANNNKNKITLVVVQQQVYM